MRVLGIETSCDETAAAVYETGRGLVSHCLHSQTEMHAPYGGVVPELASRDHIVRLARLVRRALAAAGGTPPDAVAYTAGPGLLGALLVGATLARSLAYGWRVPAIGVHHLEGHLVAPMLEDNPPDYPFLALLVSGGHTMLVEVVGLGDYRILGQSLDDAAGEAFDKTAKLLGLSYPGGPALAQLAGDGDPKRFDFPRPLTRRPGLDFSFSGLKTAVVLAVQKSAAEDYADIAASFQTAVVDTLCIKCERALDATDLDRLVVSGGVGANLLLRNRLQRVAEEAGARVYFPRPEFCTDNGAMIAYAGWLRLQAGSTGAVDARARWPLDEVAAPHST